MSGTGMTPEEDRTLRAGEYVLGTLSPAEAAAVAAAAARDPALAAEIAAWQARLAPLAAEVPPITPPAAVWAAIAAATGLAARASARGVAPRRRLWDSVALWRWTTGAGFAAAAALLALTVLRPPAPHQAAALLPAGGAKIAFLADELPAGGLRVSAVNPASVATGKDLELWALPPGGTKPVSLGVLPPTQTLVVQRPPVRLVPHTQLMVSLEPKGGSPTGLPTGPVLFAGSLTD
ncbi:anti-sigma factor [Acidisoma sp. 7E03]